MFIIKQEEAERIKRRYKLSNIAKDVGISKPYITLIFKGERPCSKKLAYCITKYISSESEIEDFFDRTSKEVN